MNKILTNMMNKINLRVALEVSDAAECLKMLSGLPPYNNSDNVNMGCLGFATSLDDRFSNDALATANHEVAREFAIDYVTPPEDVVMDSAACGLVKACWLERCADIKRDILSDAN